MGYKLFQKVRLTHVGDVVETSRLNLSFYSVHVYYISSSQIFRSLEHFKFLKVHLESLTGAVVESWGSLRALAHVWSVILISPSPNTSKELEEGNDEERELWTGDMEGADEHPGQRANDVLGWKGIEHEAYPRWQWGWEKQRHQQQEYIGCGHFFEFWWFEMLLLSNIFTFGSSASKRKKRIEHQWYHKVVPPAFLWCHCHLVSHLEALLWNILGKVFQGWSRVLGGKTVGGLVSSGWVGEPMMKVVPEYST